MPFADVVRAYCIDNYIIPARNSGDSVVSIRAGDVHRSLEYKNRLPLVCSALGAKIFEETANVERVSIAGPINGSNAIFTFKIIK